MQCRCLKRTFFFFENNLFINVSCTKSFQNLLYLYAILMILSKLNLSLHQRKIKLPLTTQNGIGFYKLVAYLHLSTFLFNGVPFATSVETTRGWLNGKLLNGRVCTRSIYRVSYLLFVRTDRALINT